MEADNTQITMQMLYETKFGITKFKNAVCMIIYVHTLKMNVLTLQVNVNIFVHKTVSYI